MGISGNLPESPNSYCGPAADPAHLLSQWNFDPLLLGGLLALFVAAAGLQRRGQMRDARRTVLLAGLMVGLYVSPFCAWGSSLFSVRVVHHLLLALVAAPLLAIIGDDQRAFGRVPGGVTFWTVIASVTMWIWHSPRLYDWAVASDLAYWLMQLTILFTAVMFWQRLRHASLPAAVVALLAAMVAMGTLGALITLAPEALYSAHFATTAAWGLSPIEDQQIAGLIMWAPACAVYLISALILVHRMTRQAASA